MSPDTQVVLTAAASAGTVGLVGWWIVRMVGRRSVRWAAVVAAVTTVLAVTAGVIATSSRMFLSEHDLGVVLIVCAVAGVVAIVVGMALGHQVRDLESEAVRLADQRDRDAALEASRRDLVAWVSHDLRTPLAGLRAMAEALEDGVADDPDLYHKQLRIEADRLSGMVDTLFLLSRLRSAKLRTRIQWVLDLIFAVLFTKPFRKQVVPSDSGIAFDVTVCPVAVYFQQQGVSELTRFAACNLDHRMAQNWGIKLERTRTIAEGSSYCDFRFKLPPKDNAQ